MTEEPNTPGESPVSLRGRKVLVVEDETIVSFLMEDMLAELGCDTVWCVASVREAMAALDGGKPDAAVVDFNLKGETAQPLAERLLDENIPFAFATGYGRGGIPDQWSRIPVLQKPFSLEALAGAFSSMLP
jgi:CheY-like chemotaxis protein